MQKKDLVVWFDHGFGDCVHFAYLLQRYKASGYNIKVHFEQNKRPLFEMAGLEYFPKPINYHPFEYPKDFNRVDSKSPWQGNKVKYSMNRHCLPEIGPIDEQWKDLEEAGPLDFSKIPEKCDAEAEAFLKDLPRPITGVHLCGTNLADMKNMSKGHQMEIYQRLLSDAGSIIILDWDNRVPLWPAGSVRHLRSDWKQICLFRLAALYRRLDLLVGVDSGPYHFARGFDLPTIGIWTGHHPSCATIPNKHAINLVRTGFGTADKFLRHTWNLVEYRDEHLPEVVSRVANQLVGKASSEYGLLKIKEVVFRDLLAKTDGFSQPGCPMAWRRRTFATMFRHLAKISEPFIVETGCIRIPEDWSAGYSTYLFSFWLASRPGRGRLDSVDVNGENLEFAKRICRGIPETHAENSISYLKRLETPVDLLYLDSVDLGEPGSEEHCLKEAVLGAPRVKPGGLLAIDDTWFENGWRGKGALAVPRLLNEHWKIVDAGYQTVLQKP